MNWWPVWFGLLSIGLGVVWYFTGTSGYGWFSGWCACGCFVSAVPGA